MNDQSLLQVYLLEAPGCHILERNGGVRHKVKAYGIDQISQEKVVIKLHGVRAVFPGAPKEVYERPNGPMDL